MIKINLVFILLLAITFWSCEEIPNGTIDTETVDYIIEGISAPSVFTYTASNPNFSTSITIDNSENVSTVWFVIQTIDGIEDVTSSIIMESTSTNSRKTYTGQVEIDENLLSGNYEVQYYVEDKIRNSGSNVVKVGTKQFKYVSAAENFTPVISDLDMPISVDKEILFSFSVFVADQNGLNDIDSVYYQVTDPSGKLILNSQNISKFPMFDNGNTAANGDETAKDGRYTVFLNYPAAAPSGEWNFNFNAVDNAGAKSNTINYTLIVNE